MSLRPRIGGALVALLTLVGTGLAAPAGAQSPAQVSGQSTARAVVIVDLGSLGGGTHTRVIEFSGSVSGIEALQLAGASPETITYGAMGEAVCKLYGAGDAAVPGQCPGGWTYYRATGGAGSWTQSGRGASSTVVHDGDVEGWRYGGGAPPFQSFCAVAGCAPPTPPATAAPGVSSAGGGVTVTGDDPATTGPSSPSTTAPATTGVSSTVPTTTSPGQRSTRQGRADDSGNQVALAAGVAGERGSGGGSGGSPVGVVVALAVAGALVATGLLVRRRRAGTG